MSQCFKKCPLAKDTPRLWFILPRSSMIVVKSSIADILVSSHHEVARRERDGTYSKLRPLAWTSHPHEEAACRLNAASIKDPSTAVTPSRKHEVTIPKASNLNSPCMNRPTLSSCLQTRDSMDCVLSDLSGLGPALMRFMLPSLYLRDFVNHSALCYCLPPREYNFNAS